jgi:hypothetical protein
MRTHLFLIIAFYLSSLSLSAAWDSKLVSYAKKFESKFKHTYLDTLHGVCGLSSYKKSKINGKIEKLKIKIPTYFKDDLEASLVVQRDGKLEKKAPLIIVFPGSFTNLDEDQAIMWMQLFSKLGYHTLLLPNPWSTDFIKSETNFLLGDFLNEAESLAFASKKVYRDLQERDLLSTSQIQIFGLSHGAFIASIVNYQFAKEKLNVAHATLVSPALNLNDSFHILDQHIEDSIEIERDRSFLGSIINFLKICKSESIEELSPKNISASKYLTAIEGFQKDLATSLIAYDDIKELNIVPLDQAKKKKWKKNLKYSEFFKSFAPELLPLYKSEKSQIEYWTEKTQKLGKKNVRILVSDNDFINKNKKLRSSTSILYLKGGGHFGFCSSPWFEKFLELSF